MGEEDEEYNNSGAQMEADIDEMYGGSDYDTEEEKES
jgi:hypothetical protein